MSLDRQLFADVVRRVLDDAAFTFSDLAETAPPCAPRLVLASLPFLGSQKGRVLLAIPPDLAIEIAANLLGVDPSASDAVDCANDATGEITNMVTASLLTAWLGADPSCNLGTPQTTLCNPEQLDTAMASAACRVVMVTETEQRIDAAVVMES